MSKFIVKTELSNIIQNKDGTFNYNEEIKWMKWNTNIRYFKNVLPVLEFLKDKEKSPRKEKKKKKKPK